MRMNWPYDQFLAPHHMEPNDKIHFYIEKFIRSTSTVLIDFVDLTGATMLPLSREFYRLTQSGATMIEIIGYEQKPLLEGRVYSMLVETFRRIAAEAQQIQDSYVVGYKISLTNQPAQIFQQTIPPRFWSSFHLPWQQSKSLGTVLGNSSPLDKIVVRNIGQGNWNEVWTNNEPQIVYDAGTAWTTKRNQFSPMIGNRNQLYQSAKPILVLSHWDVDHYQFLLAFHDDTIKTFSHFIYRDVLPNLTSQRVIARFMTISGCVLHPLKCEDPFPHKSGTKLEPPPKSQFLKSPIFQLRA